MIDCVYVLINPIDLKPFYVGKTNNPHSRLMGHIKEAKEGTKNIKKARLIMSIIERGLKPIMRIIEWCFNVDVIEREKYWIKYYRKLTNIVNRSGGGEKGGNNFGETHPNSKLTVPNVVTIIEFYKHTNLSFSQLSKLFGVQPIVISGIINGKYWKSVTGGITTISIFDKKDQRQGNRGGGNNNQRLACRILTLNQAKTIFDLFVHTTLSYSDLSKLYSVSSHTIRSIMGSMGGKAWNEINNGIRHYSLFNQKQKNENGLRTSNRIIKSKNAIISNWEQINKILELRANGMKLKEIGLKYGLSVSAVCRITKGNRWVTVNV